MKTKTVVAGNLVTLAWGVAFTSLFHSTALRPNIPDFTAVDGISPPEFLPRVLSPLSLASDTLDTHIHTIQAMLDTSPNSEADTQSIAALSKLAPALDAAQEIRNIDSQISMLLARQLRDEWVFTTNWHKHGSLLGCEPEHGSSKHSSDTNSQAKSIINTSVTLLTQKIAEAVQTRERIESLSIIIEELALSASIPNSLRSAKKLAKKELPAWSQEVSKSADSGVGAADEIVRRIRAFRDEMLQEEVWLRHHPKALARLAVNGEMDLEFYCQWEHELHKALREWKRRVQAKSAVAKKRTTRTYKLGAYIA